ncbi:MAG: MATE family efflux transporter [Treponema sp.]|nr:MATE family efflux transporter [Treponema sp.]
MAALVDSADKESEKFLKMTTVPVEKLVFTLGLPSILIMIVSAIYNMADTYFVASLGTSEVAAVGIAFPLMNLIQAIGFFFGQGSGNYMARALGGKNTDGASRMAVTGLLSGFIIMAVIAAILIFFLGPFVTFLGATETIRPHAMDFIFFILLASPWMVAATILNQQLRFQGSASIALVGIMSGAVLNIFMEPVFIFIFKLGVKGSASATMICQFISFCILYFYGTTRPSNIHINFRHFSPSLSRFMEMFRGGIPALLRQGLMSVANIIINHFAGYYGDAAIAAISIVNRITTFANSVIMGFGQGFQPICGFNFGARMYSRVKKAFWFCVRVACGSLFVICIFLEIFAPQIIALFRKDDPQVIAIGTLSLRLNCISLPFMGYATMCNMITQTMGIAFEASIIAMSRQGLMLIPILLIMRPLFGLFGIQIATPTSDMLSLAIIIPMTAKVLKMISVPDGTLSTHVPKSSQHETLDTE